MLIALYIALTFFQPGIVIPSLSESRPMLVASIIAGIAAFTNHGTDKAYVLRHPITRYLILFIATQVCSVYYSGGMVMLQELACWYQYPVFLFIVACSIDSSTTLRRSVWGLLFGASFVICYGIAAVYYQWEASLILHGKAGAYGMYQNHNDYTFLIILVFPLIVKLFFLERGACKKLCLAGMAVACTWGVFLSLSRGGILMFVLELLLLGWYSGSKRTRYLLVPLLLLVGVVAIQLQFAARDEVSEGYDTARSSYVRQELWRTGLKMVKAHPLLGVGSRRFSEYSPDYTDLSQSNVGLNAHNTMVEVVATSGLLGAFSFLGMLYFCIKELLCRKRHLLPSALAPIRDGLLISLLGLFCRSLLDAKPHEWGFYALASLILSFSAQARKEEIHV